VPDVGHAPLARITPLEPPMPTPLLPSSLAAGETYASVSDILEVQDLAEATIHVPFWTGRDGKPLALRVRGLSLEQQDQVRMLAARKVDKRDRQHGVTQHWPTFVAMTLHFGLTAPSLTPEQALALFRKNAEAVESICSFIWLLSAVAQDVIDTIVTTLARVEAGADDAPAAEPDDEPGDVRDFDPDEEAEDAEAAEPGRDSGVDGAPDPAR
jgi:hypothetical protein